MTIINSKIYRKLLSHRVRGFGVYEHCPSAFRDACASQVPYLEIDTRASSDGHIFVYHDAYTNPSSLSSRILIAETSARVIRRVRYNNGEQLLTLEQALNIFRNRTRNDQVLCIDIKDYGFENKHLRLVRNAGVESNVIFVSWIPQTIICLQEIGARSPLILSQWNLIRFGLAGKFVSMLLENCTFRIFRYVIIGRSRFADRLDGMNHGYQHAFVCDSIPNTLSNAIARSGGGICVHLSSLGRRIKSYCKKNQLRLWAFSVGGEKDFLKYGMQEGIDVLFCDDAKAIPYDHRIP